MSDAGADGGARTSADHGAADTKLYGAMRAMDFEGPEYDACARELMRRVTGQLLALARSGAVFDHLRKMNRCRRGAKPRPTEQEVRDLVASSVQDGYVAFHNDALVSGGWDPRKGSLATLLLAYCAGKYADHYDHWRRRREIGIPVGELGDEPASRHAPSAERVALARSELGEADELSFAAGLGFSQQELAEHYGTTPRAIEGRLYRVRHRPSEEI
ncbi:MAG TPA: hypothetical protein VGD67_08685 [Pseudonocardiaceae bacterium]